MKRADGSKPVSGVSGGRDASASLLPEPVFKDLSQHPQGNLPFAGASATAPSLVSSKHNCNNTRPHSCGKWSIGGQLEPGSPIKYVRLGCKKWTCPHCGPKKARRVRAGIISNAAQKDLRRFATLTLDPRHCTAEQSVDYIRATWCKMRVSLQRRLNKNVTFITVIERQKNGYAHLHVLLGHYIPQSWLSAAWQAVGGGRMVDIRCVDVHRAGAYVAKYFTKEMLLAHHGVSKYRRYTTSRDITLFIKNSQGQWWLVKFSLPAIQRYPGCSVLDQLFDSDGQLCELLTSERIF